MAQQACAPVVTERDAAKVTALHMPNSVVLGQSFVGERIVRRQELRHAAIRAQLILEKQLGLPLEGRTEVLVKLRKRLHVRRSRFQVAHVQPLAEEIADKGGRPGIGQHPAHLLRPHRGIVQLAAGGQVKKLVVGYAAPEEEGQPRSQLEVTDRVYGSRFDRCGWPFGTVEKLQVSQDAVQPPPNAGLEVPAIPTFVVEAQERPNVRLDERAAIRAAGDGGQNVSGARFFFRSARWVADEDAAAAGAVRARAVPRTDPRLRGSPRLIRSDRARRRSRKPSRSCCWPGADAQGPRLPCTRCSWAQTSRRSGAVPR